MQLFRKYVKMYTLFTYINTYTYKDQVGPSVPTIMNV